MIDRDSYAVAGLKAGEKFEDPHRRAAEIAEFTLRRGRFVCASYRDPMGGRLHRDLYRLPVLTAQLLICWKLHMEK